MNAPPTQFQRIKMSRSGPIAIVAMDRVDKRNAMDCQLLTELKTALQEQQRDENVAVVVLTGNGTVFSSGADRSAVAGLDGDDRTRVFAPIAAHLSELIGEVVFQLVSMSKLVVAAVNGHAAGGGMMTALACDFRVIADDALLWMPEVELGRAISQPAMETLLAYVGPAITKDIVVTARRIGAAEIASMGLANRVVPRADVMTASLDLARELAKRDHHAATTIKSRANRELVKIWGRS